MGNITIESQNTVARLNTYQSLYVSKGYSTEQGSGIALGRMAKSGSAKPVVNQPGRFYDVCPAAADNCRPDPVCSGCCQNMEVFKHNH